MLCFAVSILFGVSICLFSADVAAQNTPSPPPAETAAADTPEKTIIQQAPLDAVVVFDTEGNRSLYFPPGSFSMTDLDDFRRFLLKDQDKPAPFIIHYVEAAGKIAGDRAEISVRFHITTSVLHAVSVPLNFKEGILPMENQSPLQYSGEGRADLTIDPKSGQYVAVITPKQSGKEGEKPAADQKHLLSLSLWLPVSASANGTGQNSEGKCSVSFPVSVLSRFQIDVPAVNIEAEVSQGYVDRTVEETGKQTTRFTIIGLRSSTEIIWRKKKTEIADVRPALLIENASIDVRLENRSTICDATLPISSISGTFDQVLIQIPPGAKLDKETTDRYADVAGYKISETAKASVVAVHFSRKTAGPVSVRLKTVQPFDSDEPDFRRELSGFDVIGVERYTGFLAVSIPPGKNLNCERLQAVRRTETVPAAGENAAASRSNVRFEILSQPFQLRVHAVSPQARISVKPEYQIQISNSIVLNARFTYTVSGPKADHLVIQMPDTMWDCKAGPDGLVDTLAVNMDASGQLTVVLRNPADGTFTVELSATRPLLTDAQQKNEEKHRIMFALPQPQVTWTEPASVTIRPVNSSVELIPLDDSYTDLSSGAAEQQRTTGLTRQPRRLIPPGTAAAVPLQETLFYRMESGKAVFVADMIHHTQKINVSMQTDVRLFDSAEQIAQTISYNVQYAPVDKLYFLLPKSLDTAAVQVYLGNVPLEWRDTAADPASKVSENCKRKMIQLPDLMSRFQLAFHYTLPPLSVSEEKPALFSLRFIKPENIPAADHRIHFFCPAGYKIELHEESKPVWEPFRESRRPVLPPSPVVSSSAADAALSPPAAAYRSVQSPPNIAMSVSVSKDITAASVVDRAWLQTWLTGTIRQDRIYYRITPSGNSVTINLPQNAVNLHLISVRVDRKAVNNASLLPGGKLTIPVSPEQIHNPIEISVDYRYPFEIHSSDIAMALPAFPADVLVQCEFWQIILPQNKHIIRPPAGWTPEFDWTWNGLFWGRTPSIKKDRIGLEEDLPDAESQMKKASQYLYSSLHPPSPASVSSVSIRIADRAEIVFYSSSAAMLIGLILIYIPQSRYAGSLFGLGIALIAVLVWQPASMLLILQASVFGVCAALTAGYLYRIFHRQGQWIPPYPQTWNEEEPASAPAPQPVLEVIMDAEPDALPEKGAAGQSDILHNSRSGGSAAVQTGGIIGSAVFLCVFLSAAAVSAVDNENSAEESHVIQYRRWLIPEDKIRKAPFPPGRNIPIKRETFERYLEQFPQKAGAKNSGLPPVKKTVLNAKFSGNRLIDGRGTFLLQNHYSENSIPAFALPARLTLGSLTLPILNPVWGDDSEAEVACDASGTVQVIIPDQNKTFDKLRFQWSLQSRRKESGEDRNGIIFDITVPPCSGTELQIDLPAGMTLISSAGLVLPPEKNSNSPHIWTVLLGTCKSAAITVIPDQPPAAADGKPAVHQTVVYTMTQQGLETVARIAFDKSDVRLKKLTLDIEPPLRPVEVKYGGQNVLWTSYPGNNSVTKIEISIPPAVKNEPQEIAVRSLAPLQENQRWLLPRIRTDPQEVFWSDTRCAVSVAVPLLARHIACGQGIQVTPRSAFDWSERQLFTFQYFNENAQIETEIIHSPPRITVNSASQIQWGNSDIRADLFLDCSVSEGEIFTLNFPVTENWIIDSVTNYSVSDTGVSGTDTADEDGLISSWEVLSPDNRRHPQKTISIHLRRALRSKKPAVLKLSCRLVNPPQSRFSLPQLSPVQFPNRYGEQHVIAVQIQLTDYSLRSGDGVRRINRPQTVTIGSRPMSLAGHIYPLTADTADMQFDLERMKPNYAAEISGRMSIDADMLFASYRFRCEPVDSAVERVFVHFTAPLASSGKEDDGRWNWTFAEQPDSGQFIRTRKIRPEEWKEIIPLFAAPHRPEELQKGEIWEIRFDELQTLPFELSAVCSASIGNIVAVPLASLPAASAQTGELTVESGLSLNYRINNKNLNPVPIAAPPWGKYAEIKASYQYSPAEELYRNGQVFLTLQKLLPEEQNVPAWCWSLHLDSLYEPEGIVRNKALFLIENQGKDVLKMNLPQGVDRISAVYCNGQQTAWKHNQETGTVTAVLPEKEKFVSVAVEYSYQDDPLTKKRKLYPMYPGADIPILTGKWVSRFPPEYDVLLRHNVTEKEQSRFPYLKTLNYLTNGSVWETGIALVRDYFSFRQPAAGDEKKTDALFKTTAGIAAKNTSAAPWTVSSQLGEQNDFLDNWHAYELPMNVHQNLYIVHRQKFAALQWICFLGAVLITSRKPFSSPAVLIGLLIALEIAARSAASCYTGLLSGAFFGVCVSIGFALIRQKKESAKRSVPASYAFLLLTVPAAIFCTINQSSAQTAPPAQTTEQKEPYRVFFPTDAKGGITGETVYVPKEFFDILARNTEPGSPSPLPRWSMTKAVYQGSLIRNAADSRLILADDFKAVYDVVINAANVKVTLPDIPAVPGKIYWDTKPVQNVWNDPNSRSVSFTLEKEVPGKHILEVYLNPKTVLHDKDIHAVHFPIPKVPDSVLRLTVPPNTPPVTVTETIGAVTVNTPSSPIVAADLGPADSIAFQWADNINRNGTLTSEAEQYFWIKAKPSQIEMQVLFRCRISGGKVQDMTIQTDPRWHRSGQFSCDEFPAMLKTETLTDHAADITKIEFSAPVSGTITLRADFILRGFSGTYRLRVPDFRVLHTQITRSMLAVSADKNTDINYPIAGRGTGFSSYWYGTPAAFSVLLEDSLFGLTAPFFDGYRREIRETLSAEYDLSKIENDWILNIRGKKPETSVKLTQSVLLNAGESKWEAAGDFLSSANVFRHYFTIEEGMRIEKCEVRDNTGTVVESRLFAAGKDNRYLILLKRPVSEKYSVLLHGFFKAETNVEPKTVPLITFSEVQTATLILNLFRMPSVMAEVHSGTGNWGYSETVPAVPDSFSGATVVGTWIRDNFALPVNDVPPHFTLSANNPQVKIKTRLTFRHKEHEDVWMLTIHSTVDIKEGEIATLSFRWDDRCGTAVNIEPDIPWSVGSTGGMKTFVLHPAEPIRKKLDFTLSVPVNMHGMAAVIPAIFPVKNKEYLSSEMIIDLPKKINGEKITWNTQNLEPLKSPPQEDRQIFRAKDEDFSAAAHQTATPLTALLYDIGFLIKPDGSVFGIATVDLKNRGQEPFILQMPGGYELIQISADGSMVQRTRLDRNRWTVYIGSSDYPQRLCILFRTVLPAPVWQQQEKRTSALQFPVLEGIAVQETLWSLSLEDDVPAFNIDIAGTFLNHQTPLSGDEAVQTLIGLNLIREYHLIRLLNSVSSSKPADLQRWFSHWLSEWNTAADRIDDQMQRLPLTLQNIRPKFVQNQADSAAKKGQKQGYLGAFSETISRQTQKELLENKQQCVLGKKISFAGEDEKTMPMPTSQVYWQGRISADMRYFFGYSEGAVREITLTSLPEEMSWTHFFSGAVHLAAGLILVMPIIVLLLIRWVNLRELWLQFPHFWTMSFGILLWVFIPGSIIGLAVIGFTVLAFFRPSWRRRPLPGTEKNKD
ncbi:MAG: hypothetical protein LBH00_01595 [Planctomycetaceae bacterium]|jgi:hypothetical protein|nr:hypothetical protein [Planctomycetaceae bacterium]